MDDLLIYSDDDIDFDINLLLSDYDFSTKKVTQRQAANMRERRRMKTINDAFEVLRKKVPAAIDNQDKKISKVDTLKLAVDYIQYLSSVLESCGVSTQIKRKRSGITNGQVILKCMNGGNYGQNNNASEFIYGYSLSWDGETESSCKRIFARFWVPPNVGHEF